MALIALIGWLWVWITGNFQACLCIFLANNVDDLFLLCSQLLLIESSQFFHSHQLASACFPLHCSSSSVCTAVWWIGSGNSLEFTNFILAAVFLVWISCFQNRRVGQLPLLPVCVQLCRCALDARSQPVCMGELGGQPRWASYCLPTHGHRLPKWSLLCHDCS